MISLMCTDNVEPIIILFALLDGKHVGISVRGHREFVSFQDNNRATLVQFLDRKDVRRLEFDAELLGCEFHTSCGFRVSCCFLSFAA